MGRHSAPDDAADEEDGEVPPSGTVVVEAAPSGRHARRDEDARPAPTPRLSGTASDLALIRTHPDVRARCIAGALVPFVLYTAVLATLGRLHVYLLWVWIPLILAGVLVGFFLDLGHKRYSGG